MSRVPHVSLLSHLVPAALGRSIAPACCAVLCRYTRSTLTVINDFHKRTIFPNMKRKHL